MGDIVFCCTATGLLAGFVIGLQIQWVLHRRFCWCSTCAEWRASRRKEGVDPERHPGMTP